MCNMYLQFELSPELVGVIFLVMAAAYAVSSPIWGWAADKLVRLFEAEPVHKKTNNLGSDQV